MLGLRLSDGINLGDFENRYGVSLSDQFPKELKYLKSEDLIEMNDSHIRLSKKGFFLADSVILEFMPWLLLSEKYGIFENEVLLYELCKINESKPSPPKAGD